MESMNIYIKKNGTSDMRYKSSKQYFEAGNSIYGPEYDDNY